MVGRVPVGAGAPISVQSMTTTQTADVDATLAQIYALAAAGCDIVRCTCNEPEERAKSNPSGGIGVIGNVPARGQRCPEARWGFAERGSS